MSHPIWITPAGSLGLIPENTFYQLQLQASGATSFKALAGSLPPGMYVTANGYLQGVPVVTDVNNINRSYEFSIRATSGDNLISDRTFSVIISNIIPPQITPRITNLGEVFDGTFYSLQLEATEVNPNATLTWSLTSGSLPGNVTLSSSGLISGFIYPLPVEGNAGLTGFNVAPYNEFAYENAAQYQNGTYQFTVRVFDGINYDSLTYQLKIVAKDHWEADTTLDTVDSSLTVDEDNRYLPIMITPTQALPTVRSSSKFAFQFQAIDPNDYAVTYALYSSSGSNFDQNSSDNQLLAYANLTLSSSLTVSAGTIITQPGAGTVSGSVFVSSTGTTLSILGSTLNTNLNPFSDTVNYLYAGGANTGVQVTSTSYQWAYTGLGTSGVGFDTTGFDQSSLALPGGLTLDGTSGWLSGTVGSQAAASETYTFQIYAYETTQPSYASVPVQYQLTVLGDINNTIIWTTGANLGIIDNGSISQFSVSAVNNAGKSLIYSLVPDTSHLPQGLELLSSGLISGRTTFEYFGLDAGTTIIDGDVSTFDRSYTFTVLASTTDGTATNTRSFTILVNNFNKTPYENLYLKALPTIDQRQTFLSIVNNTEIFPTGLLYRSSDPWFGQAKDIRSLFLAGLNPALASTYVSAMQTNTYKKRVEFGDVKTARALDENFNVKYEVVYLELHDDAVYKGNSPANVDYDTVISANVYPNSFANMSSVIVNALGYENQGALPEWMTSPQTNHKQLGFTRAIVLAYTVPGASALIAYRLKANGIVFNSIDFVLDRYDLDNGLSKNFNISTGAFTSGAETTFDRIVRPANVSASTNFGVRGITFDSVNNNTYGQIQARGGLDGVTYFNNGDTLVFLQQENYLNATTPNDGWNLVNGSISTVVPGFLANSINPLVQNQRSGIWNINISGNIPNSANNVVTLTFNRAILPGQYVQINNGASQNNTVVYYNPVLQPGNSVPTYTVLTTYLTSANTRTRFDNFGTKFINNRDVYTSPGSSDTWLNFPNLSQLQ